jgi:hypothetical protein
MSPARTWDRQVGADGRGAREPSPAPASTLPSVSHRFMLAPDFLLKRFAASAGVPGRRGWTSRWGIHEALTSAARKLTPAAQRVYRMSPSDASRGDLLPSKPSADDRGTAKGHRGGHGG